jgi:phage terminase large subunit GpA-like protein
MDVLDAIRTRTLSRLIPPPRMDLAPWMEEFLRLPASASALPGRVRLHAHQRGIADAISDPEIERVTVQKAARVGYTTLLIGALGSYVANSPCSVLAVLPTESDCRSFVVEAVEPIFEATPVLRGLLTAEKDESGRNTLMHRRYPGGSLSIVASRAPRNLRARTAKVLAIDESDAMEVTSEGSPIDLAIKRTLTFSDRKIIMGSTPVHEETSHIIRAYNESDGRVFECPCISCGAFTEIMWGHIEWPEGEPEKAAFRCPHCSALIDESHKVAMVEAGAWRITRPEVRGHAGFRLNALISLLPNARWGTLAKEFLAAKRGGPDQLQAFINTTLGQGWRDAAEELDESELQGRVERFGLDAIPEPVRVIVAGCDTQRDRIEICFLGFSESETYILGHSVVWGAPSESTTWAEVDDALKTRWKHPLGGTIGVDAAAVDSGDGETTDAVMAFCRPRFNRRVVAIKGVAGFSRPAIEASHSKGSKLFIVGVDSVKSQLLTRLARGRSIRFSDSLTADWFEQLTSERRVIRYSRGQPVRQFVRIIGRRAEALDCVVYGLAVRGLVGVDLNRRFNELKGVAQAPRMPAVIRSKWLEGERG